MPEPQLSADQPDGAPPEDALAESRRGLRDLAALLALPAMWVDHEPGDIASGLIGVLLGVLRLESCYVRFDDPTGGQALEHWRPTGPGIPGEIESVLASAPTHETGATTVLVAHPSGVGAIRVTCLPLTFPNLSGIVLVGSRRTDFPTDHELHVLRVAVGQATISIHTARRVATERTARLAAETALRRRDAFLATLADDLSSSLATLSERAAQARAFATGSDQNPMPSSLAPENTATPTSGSRTDTLPLLAFPARLTRREIEVLGLLAQGLSNKEIAGVLWLSDRTVERHITSLYRKIGVERRSEATSYALRHGLVTAGS